MSPIAPRYRGHDASSDDPQPALTPILTIPTLDLPAEEFVTYSEPRSDDPPSVKEEPEAHSQPDLEPPTTTPDQARGLQPILGSMQDSIKRITDKATQSVKRVNQNKSSFNPVETVRGVLPGIVISISIICLWWIIGRSSPAPLRPEVARETPSKQESINPIASDPLRVAEQVKPAPDSSPPVTADANPDEQLFDHVPFINRPTNETVTQSDASQEAPARVPPSDDGPQAGTRPTPSQSGFPPAFQSEVADAQPNPTSSGNQRDVRRQSDTQRERVDVADRSTEFEWQRDNAGRRSPEVRRNPTVDRRRDGQFTAQRRDRDRPVDDRQPQRTYSYQQTDPSTYKDPVYNVPPVARRHRAAQR